MKREGRRERPQKSVRIGNGAGRRNRLRSSVIDEMNYIKAEFNKSCEYCETIWLGMVDRLPEILEGTDIPEVEFSLSDGFYQLQPALMGPEEWL